MRLSEIEDIRAAGKQGLSPSGSMILWQRLSPHRNIAWKGQDKIKSPFIYANYAKV
jgi:hypothetical protein